MDKIKVIDLSNQGLEETLAAIDLLLTSNKGMGFPAAILLFCFIEGIGHRIKGKSNATTFNILGEKEWYGLDMQPNQCKQLYDTFRSRLCHNMTLPIGFRIYFEQDKQKVFDFDPITKRVINVNLYGLHKLTEIVFENFKASEFAKSTTYELRKIEDFAKVICLTPNFKMTVQSPSGVCYYGNTDEKYFI